MWYNVRSSFEQHVAILKGFIVKLNCLVTLLSVNAKVSSQRKIILNSRCYFGKINEYMC